MQDIFTRMRTRPNLRDERESCILVCKIPLLARALGLKAKARPSARATMGYLVYNLQLCLSMCHSERQANVVRNPDPLFSTNYNIICKIIIYSRVVYKIPYRRARLAECAREQRYLAYKSSRCLNQRPISRARVPSFLSSRYTRNESG